MNYDSYVQLDFQVNQTRYFSVSDGDLWSSPQVNCDSCPRHSVNTSTCISNAIFNVVMSNGILKKLDRTRQTLDSAAIVLLIARQMYLGQMYLDTFIASSCDSASFGLDLEHGQIKQYLYCSKMQKLQNVPLHPSVRGKKMNFFIMLGSPLCIEWFHVRWTPSQSTSYSLYSGVPFLL